MLVLVITAKSTEAKTCADNNDEHSYDVTLFMPDAKISEFWSASHNFARSVAKHLNINLKIISLEGFKRTRFGFLQLITQTLTERHKPDFILSIMYGGGEYAQLELFNKLSVPFITFNSSLGPLELRVTQNPREQFQHWKAHMSPDEFSAGANVVANLVAQKGGTTLAILGGSTTSVVNKHRIEGALKQAKAESISVLAPVYTDWSVQRSMFATRTILRRAPDVDMIWTAAPEIADGARRVLAELNKSAVIGSFDWTDTNIQLIEQGDLAFSYGGHFTEAGWAIILLYDYLRGSDFATELGTMILSQLKKMDRSNINDVKYLLHKRNWSDTDFRTYSKCLNPLRDSYDFTLSPK
ncbi:substrate-binding domain-containing protein [Aliiglaciecola litoralis]|uniref:ABC transporter substrate-binding protein n=1 Tax=Aliiglaciecola litoralis TaxID=582857 RepID=A0ABN1LE18_9ALTE